MSESKDSMRGLKMEENTMILVGNSRVTAEGWKSAGKIEILDMETGTWNLYHDLGTELTDYNSTILGENLIVIGGNKGIETKNITSDASSYNLKTFEMTKLPSTDREKEYFTINVLNDNIYISGGWSYAGSLQSFQVWNPSLSNWLTLPPMLQRRHGHASAIWNDRIYVFGGYKSTDTGLETVEYFDTKKYQWFEAAPMKDGAYDFSATAIYGKIYVLGGIGANPNSPKLMNVYDPESDTWTNTISLPVPVRRHGVTTFKNKIYLSGGWNDTINNDTKEVYEFDPITAIWTPHSTHLYGRSRHALHEVSKDLINTKK